MKLSICNLRVRLHLDVFCTHGNDQSYSKVYSYKTAFKGVLPRCSDVGKNFADDHPGLRCKVTTLDFQRGSANDVVMSVKTSPY